MDLHQSVQGQLDASLVARLGAFLGLKDAESLRIGDLTLKERPEALTRLPQIGTDVLTALMPADVEPEVERLATITTIDAPRLDSMMACCLCSSI